jgi:hypothetical protein
MVNRTIYAMPPPTLGRVEPLVIHELASSTRNVLLDASSSLVFHSSALTVSDHVRTETAGATVVGTAAN